MKPTVTLLIGSPLSGDEAIFLRRLYDDLDGVEALVLANFDTPKRQIDFVVVTPAYAALLELKNFSRPIFGQQNGIWTYENAGGQRLRYAGENPWQQTKAEKFALSDEMLKFQRQNSDVPAAGGRGHFTQFAAFVCIYPEIHTDSQVTPGDHKVRVASYKDVICAIRSANLSSSWNVGDWRRFAEHHLGLMESTLDEATCPSNSDASEKVRAYRTRLQTVIGTGLAPLFSTPGDKSHGEPLITELFEQRNFVLLGPSGCTKTFHLHHVALALAAKGEELPLLIEAKKYRGGDFWTLLRHGTAALFRGDPRELLEAIKLSGVKPILMVDALNECTGKHKADLIKGAQTFVLQYGARVIFTSQDCVELAGDIAAMPKKLALPNAAHKRSIYAYHADVPATPELDYFCSGFTNAYDLTVAGRCHSSAVGPESRTGLYDRYVRCCLPEHTAVATALLRHVAGGLSATFALSMSRDQFETTAEQFLADERASLMVIDELRASRLIHLTDDAFTFEHELLFNYFKAEHLRRRYKDVQQLAAELRRPRHQDLIELILPRFSAAEDLRVILAAVDDARILSRALQGACGPLPQTELLDQCESLLDSAAQDLPSIEIQCQTFQAENGRRRFSGLEVLGNRSWEPWSALLCRAIALNLEHPRLQKKFLELLDLTESSLRSAVHKAAKTAGFKPGPIWSEAVRLYGGIMQHRPVRIPCCSILATLRMIQMFPRQFKQGLPIRGLLMERIGETPESHFSMLAVLEDLRHGDTTGDVRTNISLVKQAWESNVYILRVSALDLLQGMSSEVHQNAPEELPSIRAMLEGFDTNDIMVNTSLVEAMAAYDSMEPPVGADAALSEMRAVIDPDTGSDPAIIEIASMNGISVEQLLSDRAYGLLSNIFEDVFQGAYYEAYSELSDKDKGTILSLAANCSKPGFSTDWVLRELFRYEGERAVAVYERFAAGPAKDGFSPQDAVAAFALGVEGCARWGGMLPRLEEDENPERRAWRTIGEILFLYLKGAEPAQLDRVWRQLTGPTELAAGDVLYQLSHSQWQSRDKQVSLNLGMTFEQRVRPIVENCLKNRDSLPSIFQHGGSRDPNVIRFLIGGLGSIGDAKSISLLTTIADDRIFGKDALESIESIQKRLSRLNVVAVP